MCQGKTQIAFVLKRESVKQLTCKLASLVSLSFLDAWLVAHKGLCLFAWEADSGVTCEGGTVPVLRLAVQDKALARF